MSDERLQAGRHHLHNGRRALDLGYVDEARAHFEAARLQFRGPELRLGEGHALRGLAQVSASDGQVERADVLAHRAVVEYRELLGDLRRVDDAEAVEDIRTRASEGAAAAWVLLGELRLREGRFKAADEAFQAAQAYLEDLPDRATAGAVYMARGRLACRRGEDAEALSWFEKAHEVHRAACDLQGQALVLVAMAEVHRLTGEVARATSTLERARADAREVGDAGLESRALIALGNLALTDDRYAEARSYYQDALEHARRAADPEREGLALVGLGSAGSHSGEPDAMDRLLEGAERLSRHGTPSSAALAFYRVALHARRIEAPGVAVVAAEVARRIWGPRDPVRGQGQALRILVKGLLAVGRGRAALVAAVTREAIAGEIQPNAVAVADWIRARAPEAAVQELAALPPMALLTRTTSALDRLLQPALEALRLRPTDLSDPKKGLELVQSSWNHARGGGMAGGVVAVMVNGRTVAAGDTNGEGEALQDPDREDTDEVAEPPSGGSYVSLDDLYGTLYDGSGQG